MIQETTIRERWEEFYKSDGIKQQILPEDKENILSFFKQEFTAMVEEIEKQETDKRFSPHIRIGFVKGIEAAASIIKSKIKDLEI